MLLWEVLNTNVARSSTSTGAPGPITPRTGRSPYDKRCSALTRCGKRCRGKIRPGTDFCIFHDPEVAAKRRLALSEKPAGRRRRLSHLPDGYLRKLSNRTAVGDAMNRLYREIRLQIITPEMGRVLFDILNRLLDSGLCDRGLAMARTGVCRSRADKLRPSVSELLTRSERSAWRRAVESASSAPAVAASAALPTETAARNAVRKLSDPCEDSAGLLAIGTA